MDKKWCQYIKRFGFPRNADELPVAEVQQAILEQRVFEVQIERDGYGGGFVRFSVPENVDIELATTANRRVIVFPAPCHVDDAWAKQLSWHTGWERWTDVERESARCDAYFPEE